LLIFTEKAPLLSMQQMPEYFNFEISNNLKKALISDIVSSVAYLDSKIEVNWLPN
jgi:hypothetical protein